MSVNSVMECNSPFENVNFTCDELITYNRYYNYYQSVLDGLAIVYTVLRFIFGVAGIVGGILEFIVLTNKQFSKSSFIYHKALVCTDLLYSTVAIFCRPFVLLLIVDAQLRSYVNDLIQCYADVSSYVAELIVWSMTLERFIAIWLPTHFPLVNTNWVAGTAVFLAMLIGCVYVPEFFSMTLIVDNGTNIEVSTDWGSSLTFANLEYYSSSTELFVVYSCFALSIGVAAGLLHKSCQARKNNRKLNSQEKAAQKRQISLSFLSLSCSIPIIINISCYFVRAYGLKWDFNNNRTFQESIDNVTIALANNWVYLLQLIADVMAHCVHFYMYIWLSASFRQTVIEYFWHTKTTPVMALSAVSTRL